MIRKNKFILSLLVLFLLSTTVHAQATSIIKLQWDTTDTITNTNSFNNTLKVDTSVPVNINTSCVAKTPVVNGLITTCSGTVSVPTLSNGQHTLIITSTNVFGTASSSPLVGGPPSVPSNVIIITITVGP